MMITDNIPTTEVQDSSSGLEQMEPEKDSSKATPAGAAQLQTESKLTKATHVLEWDGGAEAADEEISPVKDAAAPCEDNSSSLDTRKSISRGPSEKGFPLPSALEVAERPATWFGFTLAQRRDTFKHCLAILFYKFGAQAFDAAYVVQVLVRFEENRYKALATLLGIRYGATAIGFLLFPPFLGRFSSKSVMSVASGCYAVLSAVLLIVDAATGGQMKQNTPDNQMKLGSWDPKLIFFIYGVAGIAYGLIETARRVVAIDIMGGQPALLRRFDATVYIVYEGSSALGSFMCPLLIETVGLNYAAFLTPVCLAVSSFVWYFVSAQGQAGKYVAKSKAPKVPEHGSFFVKAIDALGRASRETGNGILLFFKCFGHGSWLLFAHRKLVWLVLYSISLAAHNYFSSSVFPLWATSVLGEPAWSNILNGGYLIGNLLAGVLVLALSTTIRTPLPWMRLDAIALNLVWVFAYMPAEPHMVIWAWRMAAVCIPIAISVAASEIALTAHLQATMENMPNTRMELSPLPSVISVVSLFYLVIFILLSTFLGDYTDSRLKGLTGPEAMVVAKDVLKYVGGAFCSVLCVFLLVNTFIPKGAFHWNPSLLDDGDADDMRDQSIGAAAANESHRQTRNADSPAELSEAGMQAWIPAVGKHDNDGTSSAKAEESAPQLK